MDPHRARPVETWSVARRRGNRKNSREAVRRGNTRLGPSRAPAGCQRRPDPIYTGTRGGGRLSHARYGDTTCFVDAHARRAWVISRARCRLEQAGGGTVASERARARDGEWRGGGDERGGRARGGRRPAEPPRAAAERADPLVPVAEARGRAPMARPRDR